MKILTGMGTRIVAAIERHWERKRQRLPGPLGDFYRHGGNAQLYDDLPLGQDELVIDAGGYRGEWTTGMLARYGCHSEVFEPVPEFAAYCQKLFGRNARVRVHSCALGGSSRRTTFSLADASTSEFTPEAAGGQHQFETEVLDVAELVEALSKDGLDRLPQRRIGCLKLNIEGGEYEVLERLIQTDNIARCTSLLIQFHRQPPGWKERREAIISRLQITHECVWCYPMIWEKWLDRSVA